jgi:hypothetical protein
MAMELEPARVEQRNIGRTSDNKGTSVCYIWPWRVSMSLASVCMSGTGEIAATVVVLYSRD